MNDLLLFMSFRFSKRHVVGVLAVVTIIVALPLLSLVTLGSDTLQFLSSSTGPAISKGLYEGPAVTGDTYVWGNCTYWAFAMRLWAGQPIPTTWGNANTWAIRAKADGYLVDHTPSVGAVMETTAGQYGHVAYVVKVDPLTGAWTISEMNAPHLDVVDQRTLPASQDLLYNFIHGKTGTLS